MQARRRAALARDTLVVLHVLGATVWVGGTIALTFIAVPAIRTLTGEPRAAAMRGLVSAGARSAGARSSAMVVTGAPLASHLLPGSGAAAKAVFAVKMALFAALIVFAYLHDFVLGPRVAREIREGRPPVSRSRLVLVGWTSFTLTLSIPILGVVLAEIL